MILGKECDLPHPLFFGGFHGEQVRYFTRTIHPEMQEIGRQRGSCTSSRLCRLLYKKTLIDRHIYSSRLFGN
jgi:hypothetical protein